MTRLIQVAAVVAAIVAAVLFLRRFGADYIEVRHAGTAWTTNPVKIQAGAVLDRGDVTMRPSPAWATKPKNIRWRVEYDPTSSPPPRPVR